MVERAAGLIASSLFVLGGCTADVLPAHCPGGSANVSGECRTTCIDDQECLFSERCTAGICSPLPDSEGPVIRLFRATPAQVRAGDPVTLDWVAVGAEAVEIVSVVGRSGRIAGTEEVAAGFSATTELTLVAYGAGDRRAEKTVTIDVEGSVEGPKIESFSVESGDCTSVKAVWRVVPSSSLEPLLLELRDDSGNVVETQNEAVGNVELPANGSVTLTLAARQGNGVDTAMASGAPRLVCAAFASPAQIAMGDTSLIEWEVNGASSVRLQQDGATEDLWFEDPSLRSALGFMLVAPSQSPTTTYRVNASDGARRQDGVDVPISVAPSSVGGPAIRAFDVRPRTFMESPQNGANLDVSWEVEGSVARVELYVGNAAAVEVPASGRRMFAITETAVVRLVVDAGPRILERAITAWGLLPELEPNDNRVTATPLSARSCPTCARHPVGRLGVVRAGPIEGDVDTYSMSFTAAPQLVRIRLSEQANAGCSALEGLQVTLHPEFLDVVLAEGTVENGVCPDLDVKNLDPGNYFVEVYAFDGTVGTESWAYRIIVDASPPICGDGVAEGGEACDDGNLSAGDGCSAACTIEMGFGYTVQENQTTAVALPPGAPQLAFRPYANGGDPNGGGWALLRAPFPIRFFGSTYAGIVVHRDGYVTLLPDFQAAEARAIGDGARPNAQIALFGAQLTSANVTTFMQNAGGNGPRFAIDWDQAVLTSPDGQTNVVRGRIVLGEDGVIRLIYGPMEASPDVPLVFASGIEDAQGHNWHAPRECDGVCIVDQRVPPTEIIFTPR